MGKPAGFVFTFVRLVKFRISWIVILSWVGCTSQSTDIAELERAELASRHIKVVTQWKSAVFAGQIQAPRLFLEQRLDAGGLPLRETEFGEDGQAECIRRYYYDHIGRRILVYAARKDGTMLYKIAYGYAGDKLTALCFHLPGGTFKYRQVYEYDRAGRLERLSWYWPTGLRARNVYSYKGDLKVSDEEYDAANHLSYRWTYAYEGGSQPTESVQHTPGSGESRRIRSYYEGPRLVLQQSYVAGDLQEAIVYHYKDGLPQWKCNLNASARVTVFYIYRYSQTG